MKIRVETIEDVKKYIEEYFLVMLWQEGIKPPKCKTTNLPYVSTPHIHDDIIIPPEISNMMVSRAWFINDNWMSMPLIYPNEYDFLQAFFQPVSKDVGSSSLPKQELAYRYSPNKRDRKYVYRRCDKLLTRIFKAVKSVHP